MRGAELLESAGRRAFTRSDQTGAVSLLERAAALYPNDHASRPRLLHALGAALIEAGKLDDADRVLADASRAARRGRRAPRHGWSSSSSFYDCARETTAEAVAVVDSVVRVFREAEDDAGLSGALQLRAWVHWIEAQRAPRARLGSKQRCTPTGPERSTSGSTYWAGRILAPLRTDARCRRHPAMRTHTQGRERESGRSGPGAPTPRRAVRHAGSFRARESAAGREPRSFRGSRAHAELRRVSHRGWNRRAARRGRRRRRAKPPEGLQCIGGDRGSGPALHDRGATRSRAAPSATLRGGRAVRRPQ